MSAVSVAIRGACLRYQHSPAPVFNQLDLDLPAQQWTCLLGSSGCGKTSLLRLLAGLIDPLHHTSGSIQCSDGQALSGRVAYMAQQDLLMPWLNVVDNVCLAAKLQTGRIQSADRQQAMHLLQQVGLAEQAHSKPNQLSGGMRQRVAIARTLMQNTPVVLMDEPFSALDAVNRFKLQNLAASLLQQRTVLLITHDPQEALRLAHHIHLFNDRQHGKLTTLPCPHSAAPREINAELGHFHQQLLQAMQVQYV